MQAAKKLRELSEWHQRRGRSSEEIRERTEYEHILRACREGAEQGRTECSWENVSLVTFRALEENGFKVENVSSKTVIKW
jgi:hypothetical protein